LNTTDDATPSDVANDDSRDRRGHPPTDNDKQFRSD